MKRIIMWTNMNGLRLNVAKTQPVKLRRRARKEVDRIQVTINGQCLFKCDAVKYLGVLILYRSQAT